jgi:hypothetical protein
MPRAKKKTVKAKKKKASVSPARKAILENKKALWKTYYELNERAEKLMEKIRKDVKNGSVEETRRDANELLLLMGECSYMAEECKKMESRRK